MSFKVPHNIIVICDEYGIEKDLYFKYHKFYSSITRREYLNQRIRLQLWNNSVKKTDLYKLLAEQERLFLFFAYLWDPTVL